ADAPDFIISLPLSNLAAPEDGRTPPRPSPAVTDPLPLGLKIRCRNGGNELPSDLIAGKTL
ncbi:MAG TPA: hypothetical protein VIL39_06910, partial [Verrucomicrobiae bacterium]